MHYVCPLLRVLHLFLTLGCPSAPPFDSLLRAASADDSALRKTAIASLDLWEGCAFASRRIGDGRRWTIGFLDRRRALKLSAAAALVARSCRPARRGQERAQEARPSSPRSRPAFTLTKAMSRFMRLKTRATSRTLASSSGGDAVAVVDTGGSARVGAQLHQADPLRDAAADPLRDQHPHAPGSCRSETRPSRPINRRLSRHHKMARGLSARAERYIAINKEAIGEEAFAGTKIVLPTMPISETTKLDLGDREIVLEPQKTAHTDNDLIVRDSRNRHTLFSAISCSRSTCPRSTDRSSDGRRFSTRSRATPAQRVVPGHGPPSMAWPDAAKPIQHYIQVITDEVRVAAEGRPDAVGRRRNRRPFGKGCVEAVRRLSCTERFGRLRGTRVGMIPARSQAARV